jgi:hypothetical protein
MMLIEKLYEWPAQPPCSQILVKEGGCFGFDHLGRLICGMRLFREPQEEILFGFAEQWECA